MQRLGAVIALALLFWPGVADADSDGYYCVGPGYVAFETRFSQHPGRHLLHVVKFSRANGIVRLEPIPLGDFQVHDMSCGATVVELEAWTNGYSVDISDPSHPTITERPRARRRGQSGQRNLGLWAQEAVVDLEGDAVPGEFQLIIARVSRRVTGGIEDYIFTHLIRRDLEPLGRIVASLKLFEGVFLHTVD